MDDQEDMPTLSAETFAALQEFYNEEEERKNAVSATENAAFSCDMSAFTEDWNMSQFWYDDTTAKALAQECLRAAGENGSVACISAPSVFVAIKKHFPQSSAKVILFEYDRRFAQFGEEFLFYDYKSPLGVPKNLSGSFDVVMADPPFLSDECLTKTAVTVKFLAKEKIIICTGATMEDMASRLLNLSKCQFQPLHKNNLANEFLCYTNYDEFDKYTLK